MRRIALGAGLFLTLLLAGCGNSSPPQAHHDPAQDDDLIDACEHIDDLDDLDDLGDLASRHDHDDHGDPPGAIGVPGPVGQLRHP